MNFVGSISIFGYNGFLIEIAQCRERFFFEEFQVYLLLIDNFFLVRISLNKKVLLRWK